jgi:catechol 2,3-dioxygenase-like lactoylglutathione lyase family enzyme
MPTRFDHAIIAVRDLDSAITRFQHLGFDVLPGGRHTGRGTHNGLARFGLDYFELLSVYDEQEARAFQRGRILLDELGDRDGALVGFALATNAIEEDAKRFRGTGSDLSTPNPMARKRPDGNVLSWRTLAPGGNSWNKPWPFLIQWDTPDEQRLQIDRPGTHPNGTQYWAQVAVATRDLDSTLDVYRNQLGLELISLSDDASPHTRHAVFNVGKDANKYTIDLYTSDGEGPIQQILDEKGDGPFLLSYRVKDLAETRAFFAQRSIKFVERTDALVLAPEEAFGVQIRFIR